MTHRSTPISITSAPTLDRLFDERCRRSPDRIAYRQFEHGAWVTYTWSAMRAATGRWQAALRAEQLIPGDRVAIMCGNRHEWVLFDQAALGLGLVTVPVYVNDEAGNLAWLLNHSGARLLLIEKAADWRKLTSSAAARLPPIRVIVLDADETALQGATAVEDWLPYAEEFTTCAGARPDNLATIVYTSGTTGRPKGVMLSHRNILSNLHGGLQVFRLYPKSDRLLSFLPLSHTLERTVGYYLPMAAGLPVAYARSIAHLKADIKTLRPTVMITVPRVFERIHTALMARRETMSPLTRRLFDLTVDGGWTRFLYQQGREDWHPRLLFQPLLDALIANRIRAQLGSRLRLVVCGGAALPPTVARSLIGLGIPIVQGYGLTETAPVISVNPLEDNRPESVGKPLPGIEVRIGQHDELLTRSPNVMRGYWNDPKATDELIDADGWLHTGDRAEIRLSGHIVITGRIKDVIVLSNGEKVPPADMEAAIALDELVDQVMVIGEARPFLTALVVPNIEAVDRIAERQGWNTANDDTWRDHAINGLLMQHVATRTADFPAYARVRRLAVVNEPWTPENGLATPTLKLRRARIQAQYRQLTDAMYTEPRGVGSS